MPFVRRSLCRASSWATTGSPVFSAVREQNSWRSVPDHAAVATIVETSEPEQAMPFEVLLP